MKKIFLFIKCCINGKPADATTHILDISGYKFNKEYIDNKIIESLRFFALTRSKIRCVKRGHIIKLLSFIEMNARTEERFVNNTTKKVIEYCKNWPKNYIENYGDIFN